MTKYFISIAFLFLLSACTSPINNEGTIQEAEEPAQEDEASVNNEYISFNESDTVVNTSVAKVPHTKSSIPMLAVLISYNNIQITSSESTWSAKLFGTNDHQLNHYFKEVSNSKFQIARALESDGTVNDGVASVKLNYNHPDTSLDYPSLFEANAYPDLKDALIALDSKVDFSNYDEDGSGYITPDELLLTFIIAGYEDSYEGWHVTNGIWAHQYCMSDSNTATLDGVKLMGCRDNGNFALFGELHNASKPHDATIGIIAHELGHSAFSLPDLYNTSGTNGGIGYFGLMGAGTWGMQYPREYPGNTPTHFSAWSKVYNGWVTPTEESGTSSLQATSSDSYNIIKIPISTNQYYLLENRDNSGYDKGLYLLEGVFDGGMAIWKIDENKLTDSYFFNNTVNADTNNKGVDLVEATNPTIDFGGAGDEKALFYYPNVDAFGTKVTNISSRSSSMTLNIN